VAKELNTEGPIVSGRSPTSGEAASSLSYGGVVVAAVLPEVSIHVSGKLKGSGYSSSAKLPAKLTVQTPKVTSTH
jgi:hypothetical protein